jgi:soluble lytic murein transglycosylase-like protein
MRRRRRQRLKRALFAAWIAALIAGVPGATWALDLVRETTTDEIGLVRANTIETTESAQSLMRFRNKSFETRPSPTPTVVAATEVETEVVEAEVVEAAPVAEPGSVTDIIYTAAAEFGIDGAYLVSVAECESGLDPSAVNAAGYYGLFQFDETTWASYGYGSIYDATAQARTAARLLAAGQASRWPNCA